MYSKEFMKFLYGYMKENFNTQNESKSYELRFKNRGGGKPAKVYISVENK